MPSHNEAELRALLAAHGNPKEFAEALHGQIWLRYYVYKIRDISSSSGPTNLKTPSPASWPRCPRR
jgi:hypothetical protein